MLTLDLIKKFKEKLEQKKQNITRELLVFADKTNKSTDNFDTVFPNYGEHPDENAQEINTYEDTLPVEHALESDLAKINKALDKIEKGNYGICSNCGQAIDSKRLEAYPEAETCVKCVNQ